LVGSLGWRWIFFVNLPVAALAAAIGWTTFNRREQLSRGRRIDIAGPVLLAISLIGLVYGLLSANDAGWGDPRIVTCFAIAAAGMLAFLIVESRLQHPILDLRLFRRPRFVGTQLGSFTVQGSVFGLFVYLSVYFQDHLGDSVIGAGLSFLPIVIPIMIAGALVGAFLERIPARITVGTALALIAIGLTCMLGITTDTGLGHLILGMIITGLGCGIALPALGSLAVDVASHQVGMASGVNNTALQLGFALGISIYGAILATYPTTGAGYIDGLNHIILLGAITAAVGAILGFILLRNRGRTDQA
jgi:predicted MFS family arabinose efflux permease